VKIINVVGARPNFMKMAPLIEEMRKYPDLETILVHTGQHYDENMSKLFFEDLQLPKPDIYLGVGSASHIQQIAQIMVRFEKVLLKESPDLVVVVGDVNSTVACALTAVKLHIPVAHVEAGLRSFDRTMPEEINRVLTDAISDYLFITEPSAERNLLREGISKEKIHFVGNVMIDTLLRHIEKARKSQIIFRLGLNKLQERSEIGDIVPYALLTLHRPSNVDNKEIFVEILKALDEIRRYIRIVFPTHPRTKKKIVEFKLDKEFPFLNSKKSDDFLMISPLGYIDFLQLMRNAKCVFTDSGGIQEETTILGIPCLTIRNNTERPVTVEEGTNIIVGNRKDKIINGFFKVINGGVKGSNTPKLWDGKAAQRIVDILTKEFSVK